MKKYLMIAVLLCLAVPASASMFARSDVPVQDVPLLSLVRLTGAVGFDYVYAADPVTDQYVEAVPKLGAILAYRLIKDLSIGGQAWVLADDLQKKPELRLAVRWRVF